MPLLLLLPPRAASGLEICTPVKVLLAKSTCCSDGKRKNHDSTVPVSAFSLSSTTSNWFIPSKLCFWRGPDRELALIASSSKLDGSFGIEPVSLLKLRSSLRSVVREFIEFGRYPERELCARSRDRSDLRVVMEGGIVPEKELDRRVKVWRFESKEIEEGIGPKKLLSARSSVVSCVS